MSASPEAETPVHSPQHSFLAGGGEMGALMRTHDWSASSLGDPSGWPQPLRTMVRLLLNTGHPMYLFWGEDGACLYNDAYRHSIGPERHPGSLGRPAREVWDEIWDIIGPQIEQVRSGRGATWHENQLVPITRNDRREDVYWTYSYSPVDDDSAPHGVGGVLVVCTETTAHVKAEQRLAAQAERQQRLFQQAPGFICILNGPEHVFEFVNDTYARLFGTRTWIGRPVREVFPDVAGQGYFELLDRAYNSGERVIVNAAPLRFRDDDGNEVERLLDFIYAPVHDELGTVTGIFCEGHDVTEVHKAREAQEQQRQHLHELAAALSDADRHKTQFLAMLAHELRNPLAPIRNGLAVMRLAADNPEMLARTREIIDRQVGHMARLIDDLLDVARISGGKMGFRKEPADLRTVLANAVEASLPQIESNRHTLDVQVGERALPVQVDVVRIAQVISNLLDNAAKYTPPDGRIVLQAEREGEQVVIRVVDSGIGLAPESLESVFDMFRQVGGRGGQRTEGGLGIGLTLVLRIVQHHGGSVVASSDGLGQGATFTVRLPLLQAQEDTGQGSGHDAAAHATATRAPQLRVLIVDDNRDAAETLVTMLQLSGHVTRIAHNAMEAQKIASEFAPDLAFLDIGLPDMSGYDLARALRRTEGLEHTILVALTGWGAEGDRRKSKQAGFDHHLTKPADFAAIESLLAACTAPA